MHEVDSFVSWTCPEARGLPQHAPTRLACNETSETEGGQLQAAVDVVQSLAQLSITPAQALNSRPPTPSEDQTDPRRRLSTRWKAAHRRQATMLQAVAEQMHLSILLVAQVRLSDGLSAIHCSWKC